MRPLASVIVLVLAASTAPAARADVGELVMAQWGGSGDQRGGGGAGGSGVGPTPIPRSATPMPQTRPPGAAALDRATDFEARWGPPREKPDDKPEKRRIPKDRDRFDDRPFLFLDDDDFDDDGDRVIIVPPAPAERAEPEVEATPADPPVPPDPRGPKFVPARGAEGAARYTVGEPLPAGEPFVTLDWSQYGLPEPPAGLIYVRVAGDVLLLDPVTRTVERRVDPAKLEAAEGEPGSG